MEIGTTTVALLRRWREVGEVVDRATASVLANHGLNETAAAVLMALGDASLPTMRDLAQLLHCDPSNVTLVATRLVDEGMVERRLHPSDGRARVLLLTARGAETRARLLTELAASSPLGALGVDDQQRLLDLLGRTAT